MTMLDPFNRSRLPAGFTREDRVRLVAEAAEALMRGELPSPAARLFVGGAMSAWLREGGRLGALERDFLKVAAPRRSTMTPARVWASTCRATGADQGGTIAPSYEGEEHDDEAD